MSNQCHEAFRRARTASTRLLGPRPAAALVLGAALAVSGCSSESDTPASTATSPTAPVLQPGSPGEPNASLSGSAALPKPKGEVLEADVRFMQDMIVHHAQAIVMVSLVQERLADTQVKALAARISDEQRPEI